MATDEYHSADKKSISKYTGIFDDKELTIFITEFFKHLVLGVVNEKKGGAISGRHHVFISKTKKRGYALAIVSGIRTDIIKDVLKITKHEDLI